MDYNKASLELHKKLAGKFSVDPKMPVADKEALSLLYTPGVAEPCRKIHEDPESIYDYTAKNNLVAVVTDGTAVLGLGNIGAGAGLPVMEGKCILFKAFGGVDAVPICLDTEDPEDIIRTVKMMSPSFGGINLEDISAPRCFHIEQRLRELLPIPVFHDDQHGTAIVTLAALINALKATGKERCRVVISGAGAAGVAIVKILRNYGIDDIMLCDSRGIISRSRTDLNAVKREIAEYTNPENMDGTLHDAIAGRDVFIGVSAPDILTSNDISTMSPKPIVFAMSNPTPEIHPQDATLGGASVVATGRSDFPNQINNVLAFPGIFRGALDVRATGINEEMKLAAASAIAALVSDDEIGSGTVIPSPFDARVAEECAYAAAKAAIDSGIARVPLEGRELRARIATMLDQMRNRA
jgi:malate dehydrogenase (oxaloacetate-decarboxylating)